MNDRIYKWRGRWKIRGVYGITFKKYENAVAYFEKYESEQLSGTAYPVNESTTTVTGTLSSGGESPEPEPSEGSEGGSPTDLESFWSEDV